MPREVLPPEGDVESDGHGLTEEAGQKTIFHVCWCPADMLLSWVFRPDPDPNGRRPLLPALQRTGQGGLWQEEGLLAQAVGRAISSAALRTSRGREADWPRHSVEPRAVTLANPDPFPSLRTVPPFRCDPCEGSTVFHVAFLLLGHCAVDVSLKTEDCAVDSCVCRSQSRGPGNRDQPVAEAQWAPGPALPPPGSVAQLRGTLHSQTAATLQALAGSTWAPSRRGP